MSPLPSEKEGGRGWPTKGERDQMVPLISKRGEERGEGLGPGEGSADVAVTIIEGRREGLPAEGVVGVGIRCRHCHQRRRAGGAGQPRGKGIRWCHSYQKEGKRGEKAWAQGRDQLMLPLLS